MTNNNYVSQIQSLLSEVLEIALEEIPADMAFGDMPQWDSMGHMEVMLRLEEEYGVELSADTIGELTSIAAICAYLEQKK